MLLGTALATSALPAQPAKSCLSKNKFLGEMSNATPYNVTIFEEPKYPTERPYTHCEAEWNRHGSCCDTHDLKSLQNFEFSTVDYNKWQISSAISNLL